jgi:hypothetical protein
MSLLFDNVDDYAISATPPATAAPLTICAWVKPTSIGAQDYIVALGDANGATVTQCFALRMKADGQLEMYTADTAGTPDVTANTTSTMSTSAWNHCAGIWTSSTDRRVVLNGNWAESDTSNAPRVPSGVTDLIVGISPAMDLDGTPTLTNEWNGRIAHIAIWNVALSQSEIESLAAGASPYSVQSGSLVSYIRTTESGSPGEDAVGSSDLTLVNQTAYDSDNPTILSSGGAAYYYAMNF